MKQCLRSAAFLALLTACTPPPALPASAPARARVITGFAHPESVASDGHRFFVSNMGTELDPLKKDGDGFISEVDADGQIVALRAFAPLDAPKGMAVVGRVLYVADIDRVVGFDIPGRARVLEIASPGVACGTLLNDLAVESDESLLVTDTLAGTVYRLRLADHSLSEIASHLDGANGIVVDPVARVAYVAGIGRRFAGGDLFTIPLGGGAARRLGTAHGLFDGIALLSSGELVVSDWVGLTGPRSGTLTRYAADGRWRGALTLPEPLHGPADFFYDRAREQLWIPRTVDGSVSIMAAL